MKINTLSQMKGKLVKVALILAIALLTACSIVSASASGVTSNNKIATFTACHATGDPANPYEVITVTNDISPVPANGCPASPMLISDGKITICHATGSETNPYKKLTVSIIGLNGHGTHENDVFPNSEGSCPTNSGVTGNNTAPSTVCHATGDLANPYEELTVNSAELEEHLGHPNDFNPAPINGCPTSPVIISDGKITICHATGSQANPYNEITVSVNGLNGHDKHEGDIIPAPEGGCPATPVVINNGKITICHATGSQTNPFVEITVSVNGLNGHDKHKDDIIPAPAGGCPTTPQNNNPKNNKP
jgi:hypothetical protein